MISIATNLLSMVLPFFICVTMIMIMRKVAVNVGLLDKPCERKKHEGLVPLVGGIAIFSAFAISAMLLAPSWSTLALVTIATIVVVLGVLDDMHGLQTRKRFFVQILAAVAMVYIGGVHITQLGNLFGDGVVQFNAFFSLVFTVFSVVGVINAMNMVDGADGLAGGLALLSFIALSIVAFSAGEAQSMLLILIAVGALFAFLLFNVRFFGWPARIFMGDAGSMFLGFLLAWFFIELSESETQALSAVAAGWIFGLPLLDISAVMTRRLLQGRSPFQAGRDHLHHLMIDQGFSVNKTVGIMLVIHLLFIGVGLIANNNTTWDPAMLWLFVILVGVHLGITQKMQRENAKSTKKLNAPAQLTSSVSARHVAERSIAVTAKNSRQRTNHS